MALFSQVIVVSVVLEKLVDNLRGTFPDTESSESRVWFPAKKINVVFESR